MKTITLVCVLLFLATGNAMAADVAFRLTLVPSGTLTIANTATQSVLKSCSDSSASCEVLVPAGTSLTLTATPGIQSTFVGWQGQNGDAVGSACSGTTSPCSLVVNQISSIRAVFQTPTHKVTINKQGSGQATITVSHTLGGPNVISCQKEQNSCSADALAGRVLTWSLVPETGTTFNGWSNQTGSLVGSPCVNTTQPCQFTLLADSSMTANLSVTLVAIDVSKSQDGTGTVTDQLTDKLLCIQGAPIPRCISSYPKGTRVTLRATPGTGSIFTQWTNATGSAAVCNNSSNPFCPFTIDDPSSIKANFVPETVVLQAGITGDGSGNVVVKNASGISVINCGTTGTKCSASFPGGTSITISASPQLNSKFTKWENGTGSASGCNGKTSQNCTFVLNANSSIRASIFSLNQPVE